MKGEGYMSQRGDRGEGHARRLGRFGGHRGGGVGGAGKGGGGPSGSQPPLSSNRRYLAPEYFKHGIVDEKTDILAFGVLLLEIVTGRRPIDCSKLSLLQWVSIMRPAMRRPSMGEVLHFLSTDDCLKEPEK